MKKKLPPPLKRSEYLQVAGHVNIWSYLPAKPLFYFVDETEGLNGPYESIEEAERELDRYCNEFLRPRRLHEAK